MLDEINASTPKVLILLNAAIANGVGNEGDGWAEFVVRVKHT